jgi:hypothetical protein
VAKFSYKIAFDEYVPGHRFHGLDRLDRARRPIARPLHVACPADAPA